jgi:tungstate transport system ATP-binding protein
MNAPHSILPLSLEDVWFKTPLHGKSGGLPLIKAMTLTLEAGPRTVIVGPNGAGKSLLLRLCHGLIAPTQGRVQWAAPQAALKQAMVFQRPVMLRRSVTANINHALALHKVPRGERAAIIEDVLDKTGLSRHADASARVLSGGEQQRLALARAWALKPQVLFLDEPTASLDPSATHQIEKLVNAIHAQGTKIIMTSHDLGQARRMGDEVLFLHRGRLLERAPAEQFFTQPHNDLAQAFVKGELLWWRRGEGPRYDQDAKDRHGPRHIR